MLFFIFARGMYNHFTDVVTVKFLKGMILRQLFFSIHFPKNLNYLIHKLYILFIKLSIYYAVRLISLLLGIKIQRFPSKITCIFYWAYVFKCYLKFISRKMIIIISRSMKGWGCLYENLYRYMHWYSTLVYLKSLFSFSKKIFIIFQCSCTVSYKQNFPPLYIEWDGRPFSCIYTIQ